MLSLRAHLLISGLLFLALVLTAAAAGWIHSVVGDAHAYQIGAIAVLGGLALAFGFSLVPVMVKLVLGTQRAIGNQDLPAVRAALKAETLIVWAIWLLMGAGTAIAVPAAIMDGAFGPAGPGSSASAPVMSSADAR